METKILFIQGIHNFSLREKFVSDVSEATGLPVIHIPVSYGLKDTKAHTALLKELAQRIERDDARFVILAHSFGGVLAYCLPDKCYEKIDKIISFASPHALVPSSLSRIVSFLPYKNEVPVKVQDSYGFYLDPVVPFFLTRYQRGRAHKNTLGTHTWVPDRKKFFRRITLGEGE